jgi:hypothetical protein
MGKTHKDKENQYKSRIQDELNTYNSILDKANKIVSIVPRVEELKEEAVAKLLAADELPEDILEELTPRLLVDHDSDLSYMKFLDNSLPDINPTRALFSSTSGTSSAITATITTAYPEPIDRPIWATNVIDRFSEIADLKTKRNELPQAISALSASLGEEFRRAEESIQKAKAGIIQPHQAAGSMRNIIQQVWGEFVARANNNPIGIRPSNKRYELKKAAHRAEISKAISGSPNPAILEERLAILYGVYQDLSGLSKKTGTPHLKLLHDLRTRWILALDSLRPYFI